MSVATRLILAIKQMLGLPPHVNIDPEAGLEQIAQKFMLMHGERVISHAALSMLVLMANGPTDPDPKDKPMLSDVLGGVAMDFGLYGYSMADLDAIFAVPERPKVEAVPRKLVALH